MAQESVLRITIDSRNAERNARALANELGSIEKKGDFASKSMDSMSVATRQLAGYMAGLVTVSATINKMDAYTNLQNRLKLVTNSQQELNTAMNDTFKIAQSSYQTWDSVVQVYQRFSDNAKTLGINMEQTAKLTETVSKAVAVSGASTQAAEAALTQFGQALASGTLRGEELNSILEQTPALAKAIAQGMGITVGQLRSVAAEGKITGDVLVDALTKSADSVEQLFQKTDITISQSIGLLSNELTKFIGEAGQSSGAASLLAESVKLLAQNLSLLADAAVIGGIGYITKAILTKTVAVQGAIAASVAQKAADAAEAQSSLAVATAKVNEAKAHLANVQATNAETQAKYGAAAANARYKLASDAVTQSIIAQNAAQGALNTSMGLGSRALALVGGPIGAITLGVGALAAGYMYLQNRTAEANAKLEEQGKVANKTKQELLALRGVQLDVAKDDLKASFEAQNQALRKADIAFNGFVATIAKSKQSSAEAKEVYDQVRQGLLSQEEAIERLNRLDLLTPEQKAQGLDLINTYEDARRKAQENADAQKVLKIEVDLAGNAMQNAAGQARDKASAMGDDANATRDAAQANREYTASLQQKLFDQAFITRLVTKHNKTQQEANLLLEAHKKTNGQISAQDKELIAGITAQQKALENYGKVQSTTSKARTSAARSQAKEERSATRDAERAAQERLQIEYQYADDLKKGYLDLDAEIKRIIESGADSSFIQKAKDRHNFEEELYLRSLTEQINAYKWSEEEKLIYAIDTQKLIANESGKYNDDHKRAVLDSLDAQRDYELAQIKLAKETRIFQAQQVLMTEQEAVSARYALEMREIAKIADLKERQAIAEARTAAFIRGNLRPQGDPLRPESSQTNVQKLQEETGRELLEMQNRYMLAQQMAKSNADELLRIDREYLAAKEQLQSEYDIKVVEARAADHQNQMQNYSNMISITQGTWSKMTDMVKQAQGENSSAYKAMFLVQQGMAAAQAIIYANLASAAALAPPPIGLGPVAGAPLSALIKTNGYVSAALIAAETIAGFANGGYTGHGAKYEPAGIVHKGEGVLTQEEIRALGGPAGFEDLRKSIRRGYATGGLVADTHRVGMGAVSAINSGRGSSDKATMVQPIVNIHTLPGETADTSWDNGQLDVRIRKIAKEEAKAPWSELNNPNSYSSKQIQRNTTAGVKR